MQKKTGLALKFGSNKNPQFWLNQANINSILNELVILAKIHYDWSKSVDFYQ